ncbi:unnamed protein product [Polarella glacialis]|uniref:Uncharacterized protein n=1 Tax=Polarella glacialis TaxID=89957 RepID=A0A813HNN3_POLGL|nr:unnamed protein product [Polarella glacialis]
MPILCVVGVGEKGVGEYVAAKFQAEGYTVAMLARRKVNLDALEAQYPGTKGYVCDVSDTAQIDAAVAAIESELGPIDVLVFNASYGPFKPLLETTQDEFDLAMKTGPGGLFAFAKAVAPGMIARGGGVIGVTGATAAWRGMPSTAAKAPGNGAMRMLAQSLARDLGPKGVHCFHVVIDGIIDQPRTHDWMPNKPDEEFMNPAAIAEVYWSMANQPRSCWGFEINVMAAACCGSMASI